MTKIQCLWFIVLLSFGLFLWGCEETAVRVEQNAPAVAAEPEKPSPQPAAADQEPQAAVQDVRPQPKAPVAVKTPKVPASSIQANKGPRIEVTKGVHDFGDIGPDSQHTCTFTFRNAGSEKLVIDQVQSTCGCSVPTLNKKEYAPGESGTVEVRFHASAAKGTVNKHLYIISNDTANPRAELEVKSNVVVKVEITPERVDLRLDQPNAGMVPVTIRSTDDKEFSVTGVTSSNNAFTVPFDPKAKAKEFVLAPTADPNLLSKQPNGILRFDVDHPQGGMLIVNFTMLARYEVNRPRIIIQNTSPGQKEVKDVLIRSNYNESLEIQTAESRQGTMKIVKQTKEGNALNLDVEITMPQQSSGRRYFSDEMTIRLTNGEEIPIRVSGWYRQ